MNNNDVTTLTPLAMYEHGNAEYRHKVSPEPFPVIVRQKVRYASEIEFSNIRTLTTYNLGDHVPSPDTVSSTPVRRLDPALDKPMVLMIMTHPLKTDIDDISKAMHTLSYWRGGGMTSTMQWRIGADRLWTLHHFDPIPETRSHVIIRQGFMVTSIEDHNGPVENSIYDSEIRRRQEALGRGIHWHRHYASDAPVPGTALHSAGQSTEHQLAQWFAKRLSVPLPDGTEQIVLGTEVVLEGAGGFAYSAIRRGGDILAHRCRFTFSLNDEFNDTLTWIASYESSGWDETYFPAHLAAMLTSPISPFSAAWRKRSGLL